MVREDGSLTETEKAHYDEHGYVIAKGVLRDEDFESFERDYDALVSEQAAKWVAAGHLKHGHEEAPFATRLGLIYADLPVELESEMAAFGEQLDIMYARQRGFYSFLFRDRLLNAVGSVVGPEISANPICHARAYLPSRNGTDQPDIGAATKTPWHQDQGVTLEEADASEILTCWIPLVDAPRALGCLELIPDQAQHGLLLHEKRAGYGTTIAEAALPKAPTVFCEMQRGDILFMHRYTPHRTGGPNISKDHTVRWSLDLRFQKTGTPSGRPFWPSFTIRSADPNAVHHD